MPSSVIRAFWYHPAQRRLDVLFVNGRRYSYHDVPLAIAEALRQAPSKGAYFNARVRDRFRFSRETEPQW
jgi:hypothetical protein